MNARIDEGLRKLAELKNQQPKNKRWTAVTVTLKLNSLMTKIERAVAIQK